MKRCVTWLLSAVVLAGVAPVLLLPPGRGQTKATATTSR